MMTYDLLDFEKEILFPGSILARAGGCCCKTEKSVTGVERGAKQHKSNSLLFDKFWNFSE